MKSVHKTVIGVFISGMLSVVGCGSSSGSPPRDRCAEPTVSECLDLEITDECSLVTDNFEDICQQTFQAENTSPKLTPAVVPELVGAYYREREIKDVVHEEQPPLYIPEDDTGWFSLRGARNSLLNINDKILVKKIYDHSDVFNALDDSFEISSQFATLLPHSKSKGPLPVVQNSDAQYMFDGLSYTQTNIYDKLDSFYVGEVTEWNDNGLAVESCEEYVYERYYGFTLFKDFATLHFDDPYRVAEYAFQGAYLDENGIHISDFGNIKPGAIGSRNLRYNEGDPQIISKKGTAVIPDPFMVFAEPTGKNEYMDSAAYRLDFTYMNWPTSPCYSYMHGINDLLDENVLRYSDEQTDCSQVSGACGPTSEDLLPKNFFLETLGKIDPDNTEPDEGIVLSDTTLKAVYSQPDFDDAARALGDRGYINNWTYHLVMLDAAKRMIPDKQLRKQKLLEYKLLRKHLIDLLAERAYWENKLISGPHLPTRTKTLLTSTETLSPSEKEYAQQKLDEYSSGNYSKGLIDISITPPGFITNEARCRELDAQIEAVLLAAKTKGCLETDTDPSFHNYPTVNNDTIYHFGAPWSIAEMPDWLEDHAYDLSYDKAFCDWSPEKLVDAAQNLLPGAVLDNAYSQCRRVTGGDFEGTAPESYTFDFPTDCEDLNQFNIWEPNIQADFTQDTNQFDKFAKLVEYYPKALCHCDSIIEGMVVKELESHGLNYYDPVSQKVMMSKSRSFYDAFGGNYAGIRFGYALGWLYEGYDNIGTITTQNDGGLDRGFVCSDTHYFAFGNYFVEGSFLTHDFVLCSAGSYASNKTASTSRPDPPTLSDSNLRDRIIDDMADVAADEGVGLSSFMFIKNEKMTYTWDNTSGLQGSEVNVSYADVYDTTTHSINYQNGAASDAQMLSISMRQNVPVCGIISVTVKGAVAGDIDADTYLTGDNAEAFSGLRCKSMDFHYTPHIDFDGFASASVTAGISGVASVSAGIDIGLKFVGLRFPYEAELFLSESDGMVDVPNPDRKFNYDIHTNVYSSLDSQLTVLSGYFGAFVEIEYVIDSTTYRQTLFSWDGYKMTGNIDRTGELNDGEKVHVKLPVRALYGLAHKLYND